MIADALLILAALGLSLSALDVLLGEAGQKSVSSWLTAQWSRLDDLKARYPLKARQIQEMLLIFFIGIFGLYFVLDTALDVFRSWDFLHYLLGYRNDDEMYVNFMFYYKILIVALLLACLPMLPFVFIWIAQATLALTEFLLRRLAEYSKGPIIALSVIVGAVAALLKALS